MSSIKSLLTSLNLSTSEIEVYLASLKLGEAVVSEIAHTAQLPRTTTASILERLCNQGLVILEKSKGKSVYWIQDPSVLIEQEQTKLQVIQQLTGQLHAQYHQNDKKPTAEIYDTRQSITSLVSKSLAEMRKGDFMLTIDSPGVGNYQQVMSDETFHALSRIKVSKGIQTRSLIPSDQENFVRPQALVHAITVKVLPPGILFDSSMWIFSNSVVLFSGTHIFAVKISNKHMAESMRSVFNFLWQQSRPLQNINN